MEKHRTDCCALMQLSRVDNNTSLRALKADIEKKILEIQPNDGQEVDAELEKRATMFGKTLNRDNRTAKELKDEALKIAAKSDVIIAALGESAEFSGESSSRTSIEIPQAQKELLNALLKTGKPVVLHVHITELNKTGGQGGHHEDFCQRKTAFRQGRQEAPFPRCRCAGRRPQDLRQAHPQMRTRWPGCGHRCRGRSSGTRRRRQGRRQGITTSRIVRTKGREHDAPGLLCVLSISA